MTWFNVPSTFIKTKNHLNYFWNIFVFFSTKVHYIHFDKYTPISHFIKWNEIVSFLISRLRLYYNIIWKNKLWKYFRSLRWDTFKLESSTMWHPKGDHCSVLSPMNMIYVFPTFMLCCMYYFHFVMICLKIIITIAIYEKFNFKTSNSISKDKGLQPVTSE